MFPGEGCHHFVILALGIALDRCYLVLEKLLGLLRLRIIVLLFVFLFEFWIGLRRVVKIKLVGRGLVIYYVLEFFRPLYQFDV